MQNKRFKDHLESLYDYINNEEDALSLLGIAGAYTSARLPDVE